MQDKSFWWAVASAVAMAIGSVGPWARVLGLVSVNGTEGDGWIVIAAAVVAIALILLRRWRRLRLWPVGLAFVVAVVAAGTAIYDWSDLSRVASEIGLVDPAWGIYVATIGSVSLALACVGLAVELRSARKGVAVPEPGK